MFVSCLRLTFLSPWQQRPGQRLLLVVDSSLLLLLLLFQVNENDRLWGDDRDSTLPSPGLSDRGADPAHLTFTLSLAWLVPLLLSNQ